MSARTKKHPIKDDFIHLVYNGEVYEIPKQVAEQYKVSKQQTVSEDAIFADDLFAELDQKYSKPGVLLKGLRHKEGLSQVEFAKRVHITQSDLSKMEHGKRAIGKVIAKRIAQEFGADYRIFLG